MAAVALPPWVDETFSGIEDDPAAIAVADAPVEDRVWLMIRILPAWYQPVFAARASNKAGPLLQPQYSSALDRMYTQVVARSRPEDPFGDPNIYELYLRGLSASSLRSALLATGYPPWLLARVSSVEDLESSLRADLRFSFLEKERGVHLGSLAARHADFPPPPIIP